MAKDKETPEAPEKELTVAELTAKLAATEKELKALKKVGAAAPEASTKLSDKEREFELAGVNYRLVNVDAIFFKGRKVTAAEVVADGSIHSVLVLNKSPYVKEISK